MDAEDKAKRDEKMKKARNSFDLYDKLIAVKLDANTELYKCYDELEAAFPEYKSHPLWKKFHEKLLVNSALSIVDIAAANSLTAMFTLTDNPLAKAKARGYHTYILNALAREEFLNNLPIQDGKNYPQLVREGKVLCPECKTQMKSESLRVIKFDNEIHMVCDKIECFEKNIQKIIDVVKKSEEKIDETG